MITRKGIEYYSKDEMIDMYCERLTEPRPIKPTINTIKSLIDIILDLAGLKDVSVEIDELSGRVYWQEGSSLEVISKTEMMDRLTKTKEK